VRLENPRPGEWPGGGPGGGLPGRSAGPASSGGCAPRCASPRWSTLVCQLRAASRRAALEPHQGAQPSSHAPPLPASVRRLCAAAPQCASLRAAAARCSVARRLPRPGPTARRGGTRLPRPPSRGRDGPRAWPPPAATLGSLAAARRDPPRLLCRLRGGHGHAGAAVAAAPAAPAGTVARRGPPWAPPRRHGQFGPAVARSPTLTPAVRRCEVSRRGRRCRFSQTKRATAVSHAAGRREPRRSRRQDRALEAAGDRNNNYF
jgi:hypothetical protein